MLYKYIIWGCNNRPFYRIEVSLFQSVLVEGFQESRSAALTHSLYVQQSQCKSGTKLTVTCEHWIKCMRIIIIMWRPTYYIQVGSLASPTWLASAPPSVAFARSITGCDELARFNYSECGLRLLRSLTHMGVMSSLASATPSVAYARFARSLTWVWWGREGTWLNSCDNMITRSSFARSLTGRDEFARFSYSECGLRSLRSLTHMGVMR